MKTEDWEEWLKRQVKDKEIVLEAREKRSLRKYLSTIKSLVTMEIIIGLLAVFLMFYKFGSDKLIENLLSWVIGITIVTTLVVLIGRYSKIRFKFFKNKTSINL